MNTTDPSYAPVIPRTDALLSLALMLLAAIASGIAWRVTGSLPFAVAAIGFAILAPLWYRSPMPLGALRGPAGTRLTRRRRFSRADMVSTFFGYGLLLTAIGLYLFGS